MTPSPNRAGMECSSILNHDDSEWGASREMHDGVWARSIHFRDPDDIQLEFGAWTKTFDESDVRHRPATAAGMPEPAS